MLELQSQPSLTDDDLVTEIVAVRVTTSIVESRRGRPVQGLLQLTGSALDVDACLQRAESWFDDESALSFLLDTARRIHPVRYRDPRDNYGVALDSTPTTHVAARSVLLTGEPSLKPNDDLPGPIGIWTDTPSAPSGAALTRSFHTARTTTAELRQLTVEGDAEPRTVGVSVQPIPFHRGQGTPTTDHIDFLLLTLLTASETSLS